MFAINLAASTKINQVPQRNQTGPDYRRDFLGSFTHEIVADSRGNQQHTTAHYSNSKYLPLTMTLAT
jgi:uncharacterized protein YueI